MRKIARHVLAVCVGCIFQVLPLGGVEFPVTRMDSFNEIWIGHGRTLVELKNLPHGNTNTRVSSWHFPTSVVVGMVGYGVRGGEDYRIVETNAPFKCILEGELYRMRSAYEARVCAFGTLGMNNLGLMSYAQQVSVSVLDSSTNVIFATDQQRSIYVYKNLFLTMRGGTNHLEFASGLMSAGLSAQIAP